MLALILLAAPIAIATTPIPLIELENVPLHDAIRKLASQARLNVILDPKLSAPPHNQTLVSIRWTNVTAHEALKALLEKHGLVIIETPTK